MSEIIVTQRLSGSNAKDFLRIGLGKFKITCEIKQPLFLNKETESKGSNWKHFLRTVPFSVNVAPPVK